MRIAKLFQAFLLLLIPSLSFAAQSVTPPVNFGKGVQLDRICTEIDDNAACDSGNMVGDIFGAASKRNGSSRFISQAISTNPVSSIYRASIDVGTASYRTIIATTWDRIYTSTGGAFPQWKLQKKGLVTPNQHFSFAIINGKVVMTGDALTDDVFQYDVATDSFSNLISIYAGTESVKLRAKYLLAPNNYLVLANVIDVTDSYATALSTAYPSRMYYSLFLQPSSFTASRFINIRTQDGEAVTGISEKAGNLEFYKDSSITELTYTVLNLQGAGGDISVHQIVNGFGCIAPRTLQNMGYYDAFLTKGGIILWNGGKATVLNLTDQIKPISKDIKPIIERIIKSGTYINATLKYYPKRQWLIFSYEDPYKFPTGRNNSTMIYDIRTEQWWPFYNWLPESYASMDSKGDDGTLLYGDSQDGYVYKADLAAQLDDARKELSIDPMDSGWTGGVPDYTTVVEGTASVNMVLGSGNSFSTSTTRQGLINLTEWPDKSKTTTDDQLSFKINISSIVNLTSLRIDLQVGVTVQAFDQFTTSVTISSADFVTSSGSWASYEIALSSFPIPSDWSDATIQKAPFARSITYYGIRFAATGVGNSSINLDDLRLVQSSNNPVKAFYITKQYNLGSQNEKDYRQVILTRDKPADSSFSIDAFADFGVFSNRKIIGASLPKQIFVFGYKGSNGITKLKSTDFSVVSSTLVANANTKDYMNGLADAQYVYAFDKVGNRYYKLDRASMSVVISSFGTLGSGATNFNTVNQQTIVGNYIYLTDTFNNRIKKLRRSDLAYINSFGDLGTGTTQFMSPSGITGDQSSLWVADDANFRIVKLAITSYSYISEVKIDQNAMGETVLQNDDKYVYSAYNKVSDVPYYQDVILEKRNKGDLSLVQQIKLRPNNVTAQSTYTLSGDFCLLGPYVFIGFTKDLSTTGTYYVQKRLKDTFELVSEYQTMGTQFSIVGDAEPYLPVTESDHINLGAVNSSYIQLKYYDDGQDNNFKLYNQSFAVDVHPYEE